MNPARRIAAVLLLPVFVLGFICAGYHRNWQAGGLLVVFVALGTYVGYWLLNEDGE